MSTIRYRDVYGNLRVAKYLEPVEGLVPWRKVGGETHYSLAHRYLIDGKITQVPTDAWSLVDVLENPPLYYENWDLLDNS